METVLPLSFLKFQKSKGMCLIDDVYVKLDYSFISSLFQPRLSMEDIPNGRLGQRAVPLAQAECDLGSVTVKTPSRKMAGKIVHFLVSIKRRNLVTRTSVQVR